MPLKMNHLSAFTCGIIQSENMGIVSRQAGAPLAFVNG